MKHDKQKPVVLVDMDGTICDFNHHLTHLAHDELGAPLLTKEDLTLFETENLYDVSIRDKVSKLSERKGFYQNLEPIPGAIDALIDMEKYGLCVFICTTPKKFYKNRDCSYEKHDWVMRHLGRSWTERVIFTRDKTLVHGSVLIDDKPQISGVSLPSWRHVYYDQPYNRCGTDAPRLHSWSLWKEVLIPVLFP